MGNKQNIRMNPKWLQAVELCALGQKQDKEVAEIVGVNRSTLWNWQKKPEFLQDVKEKQVLIFKNMLPQAIKTVQECMDSGNAKVRLDAARFIIDATCPEFSHPGDGQLSIGNAQFNIQVNYE